MTNIPSVVFLGENGPGVEIARNAVNPISDALVTDLQVFLLWHESRIEILKSVDDGETSHSASGLRMGKLEHRQRIVFPPEAAKPHTVHECGYVFSHKG